MGEGQVTTEEGGHSGKRVEVGGAVCGGGGGKNNTLVT